MACAAMAEQVEEARSQRHVREGGEAGDAWAASSSNAGRVSLPEWRGDAYPPFRVTASVAMPLPLRKQGRTSSADSIWPKARDGKREPLLNASTGVHSGRT
jgi:hypothetical protein